MIGEVRVQVIAVATYQVAAVALQQVSTPGLGPMTPSTVDRTDEEATETQPALDPHPMRPLGDLPNGNLRRPGGKVRPTRDEALCDLVALLKSSFYSAIKGCTRSCSCSGLPIKM